MSGAGWLDLLAGIDQEALRGHLRRQGWFRCDIDDLTRVDVVEVKELTDLPRPLLSALVKAVHRTGTSGLYQLLLLIEGDGASPTPAIASVDGFDVRAALDDPTACAALVDLVLGESVSDGTDVEHIGSETGSSSVRVGEHVLKVYRELRPGPNPELEWLELLCDAGSAHVPQLEGALASDAQRLATTLAIVQEHLTGAVAGPDYLASLAGDRAALAEASAALGAVIAEVHNSTLGGVGHEAFRPEATTPEAVALLLASAEEDIDAAGRALPDDFDGLGAVHAATAGARDLVQTLAGGGLGSVIRTHGDLRLRHAMHTDEGWKLVGFQGDLAVPSAERRRKRPGLWDVACARRSLARVGQDAGGPSDAWTQAADALTAAYRAAVEPALLPPSADLADQLIDVLEVVRVAQLVRRAEGDPGEQRRWTDALRALLGRRGST